MYIKPPKTRARSISGKKMMYMRILKSPQVVLKAKPISFPKVAKNKIKNKIVIIIHHSSYTKKVGCFDNRIVKPERSKKQIV